MRSNLERRADGDREAKTGREFHDLFEAAGAAPHHAVACEDVPDLVDRAMTTRPGDGARGGLEVRRAAGRKGEELAHMRSVRCGRSGPGGELHCSEAPGSFLVRHAG